MLEVIKKYELYSKADAYIIGFEEKGQIFFSIVEEIPVELLRLQSLSNSDEQGLYLDVRSGRRKKLLPNCTYLCDKCDLVDCKYNKGVIFEKKIYEYYGQEFRGKDNTPFYVDGDITVNGMKYQVKYRHAKVCKLSTLDRLEMLATL